MIPKVGHKEDLRPEERFGNASLECRSCLHVDCHEFPIGGNVEKLVAVTPPLGLAATASRNPKFAARGRKSLYVDFRCSRLVRRVCDPFSIRGELGLLLVEFRLQKWN